MCTISWISNKINYNTRFQPYLHLRGFSDKPDVTAVTINVSIKATFQVQLEELFKAFGSVQVLHNHSGYRCSERIGLLRIRRVLGMRVDF